MRKLLDDLVDHINERLGTGYVIDYYNPGDNPNAYKLMDSRGKELTASRMKASEFKAYLKGWIDCLDYYAEQYRNGIG